MRPMLPDGRRLGAHLPLADGMVKAVERSAEIGADAIQIFVDNPIAWRRRAEPPQELPAFRQRLVELDIRPVAIHAAYLINLASPDADLFGRSVAVLASDLRAAPSFSGRFVNVHVGSHRGSGVQAGTRRVAEGLASALAEVDGGPDAPLVVLENSAGSGFGLGIDVPELAGIRDAAIARGVPDDRLAFCLDAAHAWAAGIDLSDPGAIDAFLEDFDARIGLERLVMVHLNDSKSEFGSRIDRHEHLGAGRIGAVGLRHLLCHPALAHVAYYLETPGMDEGYDAINVARAHAIAAGEPLEDVAARGVHGQQRSGADGTGSMNVAKGVIVPIALVVLAALLRLPNLATRGTWDSDQGHDMLVLRSMVQDGVVPLLGPPTSIGDVHHGAWYYYLLSPAAFLTRGDSPLAVVLEIALAGIAAVVVTWWLARSIGGNVAGLVAGVAMAVSISAVDESTFIWNPNLIALSSAIALAGAWRAWSSGRPWWWLVAGLGTAITMQCHVLGITLLPIVGALLVADLRRAGTGALAAGAESGSRRRIVAFGLGGLAIVVLSFVPLAIHELGNDFSEVAAALDYIRAGGDPAANGPLVRFVVILARVVSWPLTGLITDGPMAAVVAGAGVLGATVVGWRFGSKSERVASRWLGLGLVWTAFALTFLSPSLATIVEGLPNDHYHAFADPMVFVLIGIGVAVLWRSVEGSSEADPGRGDPATLARRAVAVAAVGGLLAWNLAQQPPAVNPDGGFPAAAEAASRILGVTQGDGITLRSIPDFKSTEAYGYPLVRDGATVVVDAGSESVFATTGSVVIICDALFEPVVGSACNGPAEAIVAPPIRFGEPLLRFEAAPGRFISVYGPAE